MSYGKELILDLQNCDPSNFTRDNIKQFCKVLCEEIDMISEDLHFWDYEDREEYERQPDHLKGTSFIQFIRTSNITGHTLDVLKTVYLNIFSCKDFDPDVAIRVGLEFFGGEVKNQCEINRG